MGKPNIIIVVGCQRSGTTLTAQILGSHPQAVMIDENDGLYAWTTAVFNSIGTSQVNDLLLAACSNASRKYQHSDLRFTSSSRIRENIDHIVLKAPNLTYSYAQIQQYFSPAKIVYLQRDIRDVVASIMRLTNIPILANQIRFLQQAAHIQQQFPQQAAMIFDAMTPPHVKLALIAYIKMSLMDRFIEHDQFLAPLRYEQLVSAPGVEIPQLLRHLGLTWSEYCLNHAGVLQGSAPGRTQRDRPLDTTSIGSWKKTLSDDQEDDIWQVVGSFMVKMGYRRQGDFL